MEQYVVTISRQFGSLGRTIAEKMSQMLQIEYLDRDIVEATAKRMQQPISVISNEEENSKSVLMRRKYPLGMGVPSLQDEIFCVQKNIIRDFATQSSCIIVGRCADSILRDFKNHLNVYIYAPDEQRLHNCVEVLKMDSKVARKMMKDVDKARENYCKKYCGEVNSIFDNKDIMIDSSKFGVEGTARILCDIVQQQWG